MQYTDLDRPLGLGGCGKRSARDKRCGERRVPDSAQHLRASLSTCLWSASAFEQDRGHVYCSVGEVLEGGLTGRSHAQILSNGVGSYSAMRGTTFSPIDLIEDHHD